MRRLKMLGKRERNSKTQVGDYGKKMNGEGREQYRSK